MPLAGRLYQDALRANLAEFTASALVYQTEVGDLVKLPLAHKARRHPALQAWTAALEPTCV